MLIARLHMHNNRYHDTLVGRSTKTQWSAIAAASFGMQFFLPEAVAKRLPGAVEVILENMVRQRPGGELTRGRINPRLEHSVTADDCRLSRAFFC